MASAQSARTHCPQGHPYDAENTMVSGGRRRCRICHRARYQPVPKPTLAEIVAAHTGIGPNCHLWTGAVDASGYPRYGDLAVHRLVFEAAHGPIPDGFTVDHTCHNVDLSCAGGSRCMHRRCLRDDHLEAVTIGENVLRGRGPSAVNARKTHCPKGHPYDEENTYVNPTSGARMCRTCNRLRARKTAR